MTSRRNAADEEDMRLAAPRKYGQEDKPWPVRVASDAAAAADIVTAALATLATTNAASRLDFNWRAHEAASNEILEILCSKDNDIRGAALRRRDKVLASCIKGVQGLRNLTATASMKLMLKLVATTGETMKVKSLDVIAQALAVRAADAGKSESDVTMRQLADAVLSEIVLRCAPRPTIKALAGLMVKATKPMREKVAAHLDEAVTVHALTPAVAAEAPTVFAAAAIAIEEASPAARTHSRRIFGTLRNVVAPVQLATLVAKVQRPSTATRVRAAIDDAAMPPFPPGLAVAYESATIEGWADEYTEFLEERAAAAAAFRSTPRNKVAKTATAVRRDGPTQPSGAGAARSAADQSATQPATGEHKRARTRDAFAHVQSRVAGFIRRCSARRSNRVAPAPVSRTAPTEEAEPRAVKRDAPAATSTGVAVAWPARAAAEAAGTRIPRLPQRG